MVKVQAYSISRGAGHLLVLLAAQLSPAVGELDVQLGGALHNGLALEGGHVVCHLGAVLAVVHHQQLQVLHIGHNELVEAVGEDVPSLLVAAVPNVGHDDAASLELPAHAGVNTLGATPALLQFTAGEGEAWTMSTSRSDGLVHLGTAQSRGTLYCSYALTLTAILRSL